MGRPALAASAKALAAAAETSSTRGRFVARAFASSLDTVVISVLLRSAVAAFRVAVVDGAAILEEPARELATRVAPVATVDAPRAVLVAAAVDDDDGAMAPFGRAVEAAIEAPSFKPALDDTARCLPSVVAAEALDLAALALVTSPKAERLRVPSTLAPTAVDAPPRPPSALLGALPATLLLPTSPPAAADDAVAFFARRRVVRVAVGSPVGTRLAP